MSTVKEFNEQGDFQSYYAACRWLTENGYSYGSTSNNRGTGKKQPVAVMKGEYTVAQKWHNLDKEDKSRLAGIMESDDFRNGKVTVTIY